MIGGIASSIASGTAGGLANAATRSALNGSSFGDNFRAAIPDIIGQAVGNAVAGGIGTAIGKAVTDRRSRSSILTDQANGRTGESADLGFKRRPDLSDQITFGDQFGEANLVFIDSAEDTRTGLEKLLDGLVLFDLDFGGSIAGDSRDQIVSDFFVEGDPGNHASAFERRRFQLQFEQAQTATILLGSAEAATEAHLTVTLDALGGEVFGGLLGAAIRPIRGALSEIGRAFGLGSRAADNVPIAALEGGEPLARIPRSGTGAAVTPGAGLPRGLVLITDEAGNTIITSTGSLPRLNRQLQFRLDDIETQVARSARRFTENADGRTILTGVRGIVSNEDAIRLGFEFVGEGARFVTNRRGLSRLVSVDTERVFRFPSVKTPSHRTDTNFQANFITRDPGAAINISNIHLNVSPR